jgi:biotin operon repressor
VDPNSDAMLIQEVNPANGAVIAEYSAVSFPELAKSLGISSAVIDEYA